MFGGNNTFDDSIHRMLYRLIQEDLAETIRLFLERPAYLVDDIEIK